MGIIILSIIVPVPSSSFKMKISEMVTMSNSFHHSQMTVTSSFSTLSIGFLRSHDNITQTRRVTNLWNNIMSLNTTSIISNSDNTINITVETTHTDTTAVGNKIVYIN